MITIYNKKLKFEIQIDDSLPQVIFTCKDYEDIPSVKIELKGFNFHDHSNNCKDCKALVNSFGSNTNDWFISYLGRNRRIDLSKFGNSYSDNFSKFKVSEFEVISTLKLNLSTIPEKKEELENLLKQYEEDENYEKCFLLYNILKDEKS